MARCALCCKPYCLIRSRRRIICRVLYILPAGSQWHWHQPSANNHLHSLWDRSSERCLSRLPVSYKGLPFHFPASHMEEREILPSPDCLQERPQCEHLHISIEPSGFMQIRTIQTWETLWLLDSQNSESNVANVPRGTTSTPKDHVQGWHSKIVKLSAGQPNMYAFINLIMKEQFTLKLHCASYGQAVPSTQMYCAMDGRLSVLKTLLLHGPYMEVMFPILVYQYKICIYMMCWYE